MNYLYYMSIYCTLCPVTIITTQTSSIHSKTAPSGPVLAIVHYNVDWMPSDPGH